MGRRARGHKHFRQIILLDENGIEQDHYELDPLGHLKTKLELEKRTPNKVKKQDHPADIPSSPPSMPEVLSSIKLTQPLQPQPNIQQQAPSIPRRIIKKQSQGNSKTKQQNTETRPKSTTPYTPVFPTIIPMNQIFTQITFSTGGLFSTSPFFKPISA